MVCRMNIQNEYMKTTRSMHFVQLYQVFIQMYGYNIFISATYSKNEFTQKKVFSYQYNNAGCEVMDYSR